MGDDGVEGPEHGVAEEEESDDLARWFGHHLKSRYARSLGSLGYESALSETLDELKNRGGEEHRVSSFYIRVLSLSVEIGQRTCTDDCGEDRVKLHSEERHVREYAVQDGRCSRYDRHLSNLNETAGRHHAAHGQDPDERAARQPRKCGRREILVLPNDEEYQYHHDPGGHAQDTEKQTLARTVAADPRVTRQILAAVKLLLVTVTTLADVLAHHECHRGCD